MNSLNYLKLIKTIENKTREKINGSGIWEMYGFHNDTYISRMVYTDCRSAPESPRLYTTTYYINIGNFRQIIRKISHLKWKIAMLIMRSW